MRLWLIIAGLDGALAVAMAAAGAHGPIAGDGPARWFASANTLHMWHALALLGVAALAGRDGDGRPRPFLLNAAGILFVVGTILFAGTLYVQAYSGAPPVPGAAPVGGTILILGWLVLAASALPARR